MRNFILLLLLLSVSVVRAAEVVYLDDGVEQRHSAVKLGEHRYLYGPDDAAERVQLVTLEWPPYISEEICGHGWVNQVVVATLLQQGYQVEVEFMTWSHAVREAESGRAHAVFPEYFVPFSSKSDHYNARRRDLLALSVPFVGGDLSLWKNTGTHFTYSGNLYDLVAYRLGVVAGYENTPELDLMIEDGEVRTTQVADDWRNLQMLMRGRVDFIIADKAVLRYYLFSRMSRSKARETFDKIEEVLPPLAEKELYVAFSRHNRDAMEIRPVFDRAFRQLLRSGEFIRIRDAISVRANEGAGCLISATQDNS